MNLYSIVGNNCVFDFDGLGLSPYIVNGVEPPRKNRLKSGTVMSWHFYFRDVYDWDIAKTGFGGGFVTDRQMAILHRNGGAKEYEMSGRQDVRIFWCKGRRLTADGKRFKRELAEVE